MLKDCARKVCNQKAKWLHPDGTGRAYCTACKLFIEEHNPTLRTRFTRLGFPSVKEKKES